MENEPDDYKDYSHEDLLGIIDNLEEENQSLMEEIRQRDKEENRKAGKRGGRAMDSDAQDQVDSLRKKLDDVTADRDRIREEAASYKAKFQNSEEERSSLEDQLKSAPRTSAGAMRSSGARRRRSACAGSTSAR